MKAKTKKHIDLMEKTTIFFLDGEGYQIRKIKEKLQACIHCGCIPKPDEWSRQVEGVCFDCG
jgi:hypothetical protein